MPQVQQQSDITNPTVNHLLALFILSLACILTYLPVSIAELLFWDTQTYVNDNIAIHDINGSSLLWMLTQTYHANWHPLTWLSHAVDIQIFSFEPLGHHWVNVAWHIGCAFLLYLYSLKLLPILLPSRFGQGNSDLYLVSLFASLLFALHPQHVESVAWVAERKDLLCGFFYLLCLYSYHNYVTHPGPVRYAFTLGFAVAAIMAKPMAVSLPVILLVIDLLLYQRIQVFFWRRPNWHIVVLEKVPFILLAMVSIYLTLLAQSSAGAVSNLDAASLIQRLTTSIINWAEYLISTLIPLGISPYYPFESVIPWPKFILCLAGLVCVIIVAEIYRRRNTPWIMLALTYYTITVLPVIGIIQIGTIRAADRYTYLPTIPVYLMVAVFVYLAFRPNRDNRQTIKYAIPWLFCLLVIPAGLGFSSHQYSKVWQSDTTLWEFSQKKHPNNIYATIYLAEAYYRDERYKEAFPLYHLAYINRQLIAPEQRLNIFINRYFDTAYRLGLYQEAEIAIYTGMQEKRLWFLPPEAIYYNAALVNIKLAKYETALRLVEKASQTSNEEKLLLLEKRIIQLLESQP
jgi:hypothetical protein